MGCFYRHTAHNHNKSNYAYEIIFLKSIFQFSKKKRPDEIKLRAGNYKLIGIRHEKSKFAIMVIDADEEFETYEHEIERVSEILKNEKYWAVALKKLEN